jgi:predicted PurR-regulated permease PerM
MVAATKAPKEADRAEPVAPTGEPVADPAREPVADPEADARGDPAAAIGPLRGVLDRVVSVVGGTAKAIFAFWLFIGIFLFAFVPLSASFPAVARWLRELIPPAMRKQAAPLLKQMDMIVSGFVRGRFLTAGILAAIYATGWSLIGVPYAPVVGILTGVASLIPYGAALGLPVTWILVAAAAIGAEEPSLYVVAEGDGFAPIWWRILVFPAAVAVVAQLLEDYALNPLIQGKATHLHPLVIMLAIIAGGSLLGAYGMILAVPVVACAKVLLDAVVAPALNRWVEHASKSEVDPVSRG